MPSSRWQRVQDALWQAIERAPAARQAFLAEHCGGDSGLLAEVQALLDAHDGAGDFLGGPIASAGASAARGGAVPIRRLLQEVADLTAEERTAWIAAAPPQDASLRREVGALLHVYEHGLGTLPEPGFSRAADPFLGRTVSHYRIFQKLGEGGMGVVYKALDTRLDRVVALKFPARQRAGDEDAKARLIREARAASALDHVNICTIHEIGETGGGQVFIAMACYAGETLASKLERGRLALDEALRYARDIARGLAKAHEQGIVHRDIKPANVMVTDDAVVKLLDFGLASAADECLARVGAGRATPAYMSPEQARGEPVDHRSDIWSLGATMYEMLTGQRPFPGADGQAVLTAILNHEPAAVSAERPDLPRRLAEIVSRALAKRPVDRYADVRELLDDLQAVRHAPSASFPDGLATAATPRGPHAPGKLLPGGERVQATAVVWALGATGDTGGAPGRKERARVVRQTAADIMEVVRQNGGVVQHGGAAEVVALFGIPTPREDDCVRAVRSAMEVGAGLRERAVPGRWSPAVGAGIDTGLVMAREPRRTGQPHRAVGGPLAFATRLARHAGAGEVLASPDCRRLLERSFATEDGAPLPARGSKRIVTPARVVEESTAAGGLDATAPAGLAAYVGRRREMETLRRCLRLAAAQQGQVVTVTGEAGLGKSRLLHELRARLERKRVAVLQGRCPSRSGYPPFLPFIEALQDLLGIRPDAPGRPQPDEVVERIRNIAPELEPYVPLYLHLLSIPSGAHPIPKDMEGEPLHRVLVKALAAVFTLSARQDPMVVLLDDWQWSDEASRSVLEQLVELIAGYSILLVVTCRPEYEPDWARPAHQTSLRLQPLDERAATRIMKSALQAAQIPPDAAASIHERSGGNPFFLQEICRTLLEEGTVRVDQGRTVPVRSLEKLVLPTTVQAVIRTRLHRLDGASRSVLRMAAVVGRTFTRDLVEHALRTEPGTRASLDRSLAALRSGGLIHRTHVLPEVTYRFSHILTQEVAYDGVLQHQRKRAHRVVGQAIEARFAERLEEQAEVLAHHFGEAQDWRKRARYSRIAGDRSFGLGQLTQAIAQHEQAREALNRLPADTERHDAIVDLLLRQERLYDGCAGKRAEQQGAIDELFALLGRRDADPDTLAEVHVRQGDLHIIAGRFARAEEVLDEALRICRRHGSASAEQRALRSMGFLRWHQDRHEDALSVNEELVALDRQRGDAEALMMDLLNLLTILKRMKNFDRGIVCAEELLRLGEMTEDPARRLPCYSNLAEFYRALGDRPRALALLERSAKAADGLHYLRSRIYQRTLRAQILFEDGRIEESIRCYEELIEIHRGEQSRIGGARAPHASALEGLAGVLRALGENLELLQRCEEALPYLEEAASCHGRLGDPRTEALLRSKVAAAHEARERYAPAQFEWERVATLCRTCGDPAGESLALEGQGRVARAQGDIERAVARYRDALRLAETAGDAGRKGALNTTLGTLAWHRRAYEEALVHYERALTIHEARDEPAHIGHVLASIGATLHKLERPVEAVSRLEDAIRMHRRTRARQLEAYALGVLGDVHLSMGAHAEALTCYGDSLRLRLEIGDRRGEGWMLLRLARVHADRGRWDSSRTTAARAAAIAVEIGDDELTNGCRSLVGSETAPSGPPS